MRFVINLAFLLKTISTLLNRLMQFTEQLENEKTKMIQHKKKQAGVELGQAQHLLNWKRIALSFIQFEKKCG